MSIAKYSEFLDAGDVIENLRDYSLELYHNNMLTGLKTSSDVYVSKMSDIVGEMGPAISMAKDEINKQTYSISPIIGLTAALATASIFLATAYIVSGDFRKKTRDLISDYVK